MVFLQCSRCSPQWSVKMFVLIMSKNYFWTKVLYVSTYVLGWIRIGEMSTVPLLDYGSVFFPEMEIGDSDL